MTARGEVYEAVLATAAGHARTWLASMTERRVGPVATADELALAFGGPLPAKGCPPEEGVAELATRAEPGGGAAAGRGGGSRTGADGNAVRPLLRVGHGRDAARRARRRLAGERVGPE